MNINTFATNEVVEVEGVWKDIGNGAKLLVAREGNPANVKMLRKLMEPYRSAVSLHDLTDEEASEINAEVMSKTILLGWKGLADDSGVVKYSTKIAKEWLLKYKEFRKIVEALSSNVNNYRQQAIVEVQDNIKK